MTHIIRHPKYYAELRKIYKQAEKLKQQATSEHQAHSQKELDRGPGLGYSRINKTKPPLKVSSIRAVSKAGSFRAVSPRIHAVTIKDSTVGPCTCPAVSSQTTNTNPNQQASKVSSTVDHDPQATDEQAKPSLKSS